MDFPFPEGSTGWCATCAACGWSSPAESEGHANLLHSSHKTWCPGPGRKHDAGKPRWDLLPWGPLEDVAKVLEFGARKYAPNNWQKVEGGGWRYLRAGLGHLAARARGERLDPESGLPHLAHAVCCCLFLAWFDNKEI